MVSKRRQSRQACVQTDRGYAFVIAFLSFLINILISGIVWTAGVFYVVFLEQFDATKAEIALVISMNTAICLGSGPIASILVNRFGCQLVTFISGIIASLGLVASGFSTSITHLYLTFSITAGFGIGLTGIPSIAIIGFYFEKYRSLALGFACSGIGAGTMIFPPIIHALEEAYGWRGALIMCGGLYLHVAVFGVLFFPLPEHRYDTSQDEPFDDLANDLDMENKPKELSPSKMFQTQMSTKTISMDNMIQQNRRFRLESCSENNIAGNKKQQQNENIVVVSSSMIHNKVSSTDWLPGSALPRGLKKSFDNITVHGLMGSIIFHYEGDKQNDSKKESKRDFINFFIFKNVSFVMTCFNNLFLLIGMYVFYVHIITYALNQGFSGQQGRHLMSIIGVTNFIGRIAFGVIASHKNIHPIPLYMVALSFVALALGLIPTTDNFDVIATLCGVFGFMVASLGTLVPQILIEILSVQYLASSYGYVYFFEALGSLIGPPIAGYLYDKTHYYPASLFLSSAAVGLSVLFMIGPLKKVHFENKNNPDQEDETAYEVCIQQEA